MTIHILKHGLPFCRFTDLVPGKWTDGEIWTSEDEIGNILVKDMCPNCLKVHFAGTFTKIDEDVIQARRFINNRLSRLKNETEYYMMVADELYKPFVDVERVLSLVGNDEHTVIDLKQVDRLVEPTAEGKNQAIARADYKNTDTKRLSDY